MTSDDCKLLPLWRWGVVWLVVVVLCGAGSAAPAKGGPLMVKAGDVPRVFLLDAELLQESRRRVARGEAKSVAALKRLRRQADAALKIAPPSVMAKQTTPPSGDKHDYLSVGPYWWPNPKTKDGLPFVRHDGKVNPKRRHYGDATAAGKMRSAVETLALAWWFTRHEPYAAGAARLLRVWFLDADTRMNPNLNYAQGIPGRCEGRGIGIVDTNGWPALIDAAGLLKGSKAWTAADDKAFRAWFGEFLTWLIESKHGRDESRTRNNHAVQYDVQVATYALYVGKADVARKVVSAAGSRRIATQIEPDGRQSHELARTKSWSYSVFNARHFVNLARLGMHVGVDLWAYRTKDGRSIRGAVDFLLPYACGRKPWPHKQITRFQGHLLAGVLRRAAAWTSEAAYGRALVEIRGQSGSSRDHLCYPLRSSSSK